MAAPTSAHGVDAITHHTVRQQQQANEGNTDSAKELTSCTWTVMYVLLETQVVCQLAAKAEALARMLPGAQRTSHLLGAFASLHSTRLGHVLNLRCTYTLYRIELVFKWVM